VRTDKNPNKKPTGDGNPTMGGTDVNSLSTAEANDNNQFENLPVGSFLRSRFLPDNGSIGVRLTYRAERQRGVSLMRSIHNVGRPFRSFGGEHERG
jgi:hypothetical protein